MKPGLKIFVIGFFIGLLAGGVLTRYCARHYPPHPMSGDKRQERLVTRLSKDLGLTPAQRESIGAILADGRKKMDGVMSDMRPKIDQVRKETNVLIREKLEAAQQVKFDRINEKMERKLRERRGLPPPER